VPLIVDSGTYGYTFDVDARNAFRSTRAHNTVVVDDAEINPIDPVRVFELRRYARPRIERCDLGGDRLEFRGSHDGYRRLSDPLVHKRRFSLTPAELIVEDEFVGTGTHMLESFLHFRYGTSLSRLSDASYGVQSGDVRATISFTGVAANELEAREGLVSDRYGVREPAPILIASVHRPCPARLAYRIARGWTPTRSRE